MLTLRKEAEKDINQAYQWYEEKLIGLGVEFLTEVELTLEKIDTDPKTSTLVFKDIRRALCKRFPYSVYYIDLDNHVNVIAVLHQRRNSNSWKSRL